MEASNDVNFSAASIVQLDARDISSTYNTTDVSNNYIPPGLPLENNTFYGGEVNATQNKYRYYRFAISAKAGSNALHETAIGEIAFYKKKMGDLNDLTDVSISNPTEGQALVYDASLDKFVVENPNVQVRTFDIDASGGVYVIDGVNKPVFEFGKGIDVQIPRHLQARTCFQVQTIP